MTRNETIDFLIKKYGASIVHPPVEIIGTITVSLDNRQTPRERLDAFCAFLEEANARGVKPEGAGVFVDDTLTPITYITL